MGKNKRIYLSPPHMVADEKKFLLNAFHSNWIAPLGPHVDKFENEISNYINIVDACALSSGSAALHLALRILGISSKDIVLCPSLTFAASANVILYENATPVFVDVDPRYWTVDLNALECAIIIDNWISKTKEMPRLYNKLKLEQMIKEAIPLREVWLICSPAKGYIS